MKKTLLLACLLPSCVTYSFNPSQAPTEPFGSFDYVRVKQFEVGNLGSLPLSDQMTARSVSALISRKLHLDLYERGMFTGNRGEVLVITGRVVEYDPGEMSAGQWAGILAWAPSVPLLSLPGIPVPIPYPPLPGKVWRGYAGTGNLVLETSFSTVDGTLIATGTADLDVSMSTAGGNVEFAARDLVTAIAEFVEANY